MAGLFGAMVIAGAIVAVVSFRSAWRQSHLAPQLTGLVKDRVVAGVAAVRPLVTAPRTPAQRIDEALQQLDSLAEIYLGYPVYAKITEISDGTRELIKRLERRGSPSQLAMAQVQYAEILNRTSQCISEDNFKDVLDNPQYWNDPASRIREVEAVLDAVPAQITENIRQVNSETDLDFQTALAALNLYSRDAQMDSQFGAASQARGSDKW